MDKVEKIKEKVERLIEKAKQGDGEYFNGAWHTLITLTDFIDSLEEEPVIVDVPPYDYVKGFSDGRLYEKRQKEEPVNSIWHDASEMPDKEKKILTIGYNDETYVSYFNGVNPRLIKQWAYIDDLLNLTTKEEPVSGELGDYINELSKQFPEVSFAKLSRIAVRVAKWKEKEMQSTIELAEDHAMLAGIIKGTEHTIGNVRSIVNKVAYRNNGLDVNGDYCEQPYAELDNEFRKLLKEE